MNRSMSTRRIPSIRINVAPEVLRFAWIPAQPVPVLAVRRVALERVGRKPK